MLASALYVLREILAKTLNFFVDSNAEFSELYTFKLGRVAYGEILSYSLY